LGTSGRRLWRSILADFDLSEHELVLLNEACRTVDQLDAFAEVVAAQGVIEADTGKAHPAVVESRQLRLALARLVATLRMPTGDEDAVPQRRGAARGAYGRRG
jgi:hypothetical protein